MASRYGTLSAVSAASRTMAWRCRRSRAGGGEHVDVVRAVADRNGLGEGHTALFGDLPEGIGLAGAVDDRSGEATGHLAGAHLELVGGHVVDAEVGHELGDHLDEAPLTTAVT